MQDDPWKDLLDPDEEILWQGRPVAGVTLRDFRPLEAGMGLFFMGFSLFWMITASRAGGVFWMFGLIFFAVGFYNAIGAIFWKAYLRGHMHYTLTSKRCFIATDVFSRKELKTYMLNAGTELSLVDGPVGSVYFATDTKTGPNRKAEVQVGFEQIADPRKVMKLMRDAVTLNDSNADADT